jgi:Ca2+-binding EF-hand superfamily protein
MYKNEGMSRSKAKVEAEVNAAMVTYDTSGDGNLNLQEFISM